MIVVFVVQFSRMDNHTDQQGIQRNSIAPLYTDDIDFTLCSPTFALLFELTQYPI